MSNSLAYGGTWHEQLSYLQLQLPMYRGFDYEGVIMIGSLPMPVDTGA